MKFFSQSYFKYGLMMTGVIALCLITMEVTGQNETFDKSPLLFIFNTLAPFAIWYLGIRAKKKMLKDKLTFKQGLVEGVKISLVYGITSPFLFLFYYILINPQIIAYAKEVYQMKNASTAMVIAVDMFVQFAASLVFGTLYAAIISFFLKSKKK